MMRGDDASRGWSAERLGDYFLVLSGFAPPIPFSYSLVSVGFRLGRFGSDYAPDVVLSSCSLSNRFSICSCLFADTCIYIYIIYIFTYIFRAIFCQPVEF